MRGQRIVSWTTSEQQRWRRKMTSRQKMENRKKTIWSQKKERVKKHLDIIQYWVDFKFEIFFLFFFFVLHHFHNQTGHNFYFNCEGKHSSMLRVHIERIICLKLVDQQTNSIVSHTTRLLFEYGYFVGECLATCTEIIFKSQRLHIVFIKMWTTHRRTRLFLFVFLFFYFFCHVYGWRFVPVLRVLLSIRMLFFSVKLHRIMWLKCIYF